MAEAGTNAPPPPRPLSTAEINEYLDYNGTALQERREEILRALRSNLNKYETIDDDETLGIVAENMRMAGALVRTAEERRVDDKAPFLSGGRVVDAWYRTLMAPLHAGMVPIQNAMDGYAKRKLAKERAAAEAERLRLAAAARREARRAAEALEQNRDVNAALDRASQAAAEADVAADRAVARPAELTRTHGVYGAAASAREKWHWRVTNIDKVPRKYLMVDEAAIKGVAKKRDESGKPVETIPGIEWYSDVTMGVR